MTPRIHLLALAPWTLQGRLFPPQHIDGGVTLLDVEEVVDIREHRHGCASPVVMRSGRKRRGEPHLFHLFLRCDKRRDIERPPLQWCGAGTAPLFHCSEPML